jgi:uncharacterized protein YjbI with pentapeptide repeats
MANEEHLNILKQGVEVWNKWREDNPTVVPDLSLAILVEAHLGGACLDGADLTEANLIDADFRNADLTDANLSGAKLKGATFMYADLTIALLTDANLSRANLSQADLTAAGLKRTDLTAAALTGANLNEVDFTEANLSEADFTEANLTGATLIRADLTEAKLTGAVLSNAIFWDTRIARIDLSRCVQLEEAQHFGPSYIGIDTIYESKGKIPHKFLREAGVPENFIEYMSSLTGTAFEFYSCFISYSTKDEELAKRLYADLQTEGVRCWFAPEDLRIGQKFRTGIDEAIRKYDKLLLILSESSVKSNWVEKEVEAAFEKENKENKTVLFPVRLDDSVFDTEVAWAADIRRTRHIGDFTNWEKHPDYKKGFERLLRDLKSEERKKEM